MGNRKNNLSWEWSLISLEWIPDILSSIDTLIEPSWMGLHRAMTTQVANRSFANHIFSQLQTLLKETELIQEIGRHIATSVKPDSSNVKHHLFKYFNESFQPWAKFFRIVSKGKFELDFNQIVKDPPEQWPEIAKFPIFKQWAQFFQYIGLGYLVANDHFIPDSVIKDERYLNIEFVERCLKATEDPRYLTGTFSLHTEADFLAWTMGEDHLPVSDDSGLSPRIPYDQILKERETNKNKTGAWHTALTNASDIWKQSIIALLSEYPFSNLDKLIYTCKHLIDFFLFGQSMYDTDSLDKENIYTIKKKWKSVKHFMMSEQIWKNLPNLYRDIARLYWGLSYYRNSLRKPLLAVNLYDESVFNYKDFIKIKELPIKCFRSRRTLQSILKNFAAIYKSLSRLIDKRVGIHYEQHTKKLFDSTINYLPSNSLDLVDLLNDLENLVELHPEEKIRLKKFPSMDIIFGYPNNPTLQLCFWVHRYYDLLTIPQIKTVNNIRKRLDTLEKRLTDEINHYQKSLDIWEISCNRLKKKTLSLRLVQK
jgi:hypothetical protein